MTPPGLRYFDLQGGSAGKILRVDLSTGRIQTEATAAYAARFLGGRAVNSLLLLNEVSPGTKWSEPENPIIFGCGCLVGTLAPAANRVSIETMNPYSGGKGSANFGGGFGPELKYAGFDHVVVTGRAPRPVYLWIHDGEAQLRDAADIWGKTTYETEEILQRELGDDRIEIAAIGPAGENLVKAACVIGGLFKAAGGCGVGAVMGSKNLKALVARGQGAVRIADQAGFLKAVDMCRAKIEASPRTPQWRKGCIEAYCAPESPFWDLNTDRIRNGQIGNWPLEKRVNLAGKERGVLKYRKRITGCFACPAGCNQYSEISEGPFRGTQGIGYWIGSAMYSSRFDVDDAAASIKFHLSCNELGLDGDACSTVLSWAFECYEKGLITKEDTGGLELRWGDGEAMNEMVEKLAYRRGIGDLLAEGGVEAARRLGKGSEAFVAAMKGQDTVDAFRIQKGWALGLSTSPCGPRHLRGSVSSPTMCGPRHIPRETTGYENQPEAVFWQVQAKEIEDIVGICNYMGTYFGVRALEPCDYTELTRTAMGIDISEEDFMRLGQAAYNLEKAFNTIHAGFTRDDDYPPRRYVEEPIDRGPYAGSRCDRDRWDQMLDRFYELNGWDRATGLQTRSGLHALGLDEVAAKLEATGRLIES
jgi:aldehyde:ferredoxin oxidoreductase